jgi:Large-conductance mechanosensitive channel, MscL
MIEGKAAARCDQMPAARVRQEGSMAVVADFKKFLMRGNLVELAVAFVIGAVFAALVKAFIADLITPIIALIFGKPNFGTLSFTVNGSHFLYGDFINNLITFITMRPRCSSSSSGPTTR